MTVRSRSGCAPRPLPTRAEPPIAYHGARPGGPGDLYGIGFRELLIILLIALVLFGAKKLRNVGSDLGAAVRNFKKSVSEGDDEQTKQLKRRIRQGRRVQRPRQRGQVRQQAERLTAMFEVGFSEILLIFGIALLVLGPERPSEARRGPRALGRAGAGHGASAAHAARAGSPLRPDEGPAGVRPDHPRAGASRGCGTDAISGRRLGRGRSGRAGRGRHRTCWRRRRACGDERER